MVEFVADQMFGTRPQQNAHVNAGGTQETPVIARLAGGGFVAGRMSDSACFVHCCDAQAAKAGGEPLHAKLSATDFLFDSRDEKTKIRPAQPAQLSGV